MESEWKNYREKCIHPQAPDVQLNECKNAFFGGATVMYKLIVEGMERNENPEVLLMGLVSELNKYASQQVEKIPTEGSCCTY